MLEAVRIKLLGLNLLRKGVRLMEFKWIKLIKVMKLVLVILETLLK